MLQATGEFEFQFSIYITSEDEDGRKELAARPVNKEALIKAVTGLNLAGEWRITQTACGLIVSFMREEDLMVFQELDLSGALGVTASACCYSALDTYRQRVLIKEVPWLIPDREIEAALSRQGIVPLSLMRTRHGNIILEIGDPIQYNMLMQDGFNFFASARYATIPLPNNIAFIPPMPPTREPIFQPQRDAVLQCYKCQGFWHYAAQCPGTQRCVRCGDGHPVTECPRPRNDPVCVHCAGRHHAAYKLCPVRLQMRPYVPLPPVYLSAPPTPSFTH